MQFQVTLHGKIAMPYLQRYPWNLKGSVREKMKGGKGLRRKIIDGDRH